MLRNKLALVFAVIALCCGLGVSVLTHTQESAAKALASHTECYPLSEIKELEAFPQAGQWKVLYHMTQGDWYDRIHDHIYGRDEKSRRTTKHDTAEEILIEHILAYLPAGVPFDGLPEAHPQPKSTVMSLNQCLGIINLPEPRKKDVEAASLARFYPVPSTPDALWYKVSLFELKDGVRFVHFARIPFAQLRPFVYNQKHPNGEGAASTADMIETLESQAAKVEEN